MHIYKDCIEIWSFNNLTYGVVSQSFGLLSLIIIEYDAKKKDKLGQSMDEEEEFIYNSKKS